MSQIETKCPSCNAPIKLPPDAIGKKRRCRQCQTIFRISENLHLDSSNPIEPKHQKILSSKCPACSAPIKLPPEASGKKVRCKKCKMVFVIPQNTAEKQAGAKSSDTKRHYSPEPKDQAAAYGEEEFNFGDATWGDADYVDGLATLPPAIRKNKKKPADGSSAKKRKKKVVQKGVNTRVKIMLGACALAIVSVCASSVIFFAGFLDPPETDETGAFESHLQFSNESSVETFDWCASLPGCKAVSAASVDSNRAEWHRPILDFKSELATYVGKDVRWKVALMEVEDGKARLACLRNGGTTSAPVMIVSEITALRGMDTLTNSPFMLVNFNSLLGGAKVGEIFECNATLTGVNVYMERKSYVEANARQWFRRSVRPHTGTYANPEGVKAMTDHARLTFFGDLDKYISWSKVDVSLWEKDTFPDVVYEMPIITFSLDVKSLRMPTDGANLPQNILEQREGITIDEATAHLRGYWSEQKPDGRRLRIYTEKDTENAQLMYEFTIRHRDAKERGDLRSIVERGAFRVIGTSKDSSGFSVNIELTPKKTSQPRIWSLEGFAHGEFYEADKTRWYK